MSFSNPVIKFYNQVIGRFIRTKLDVNNPVDPQLLNLSQSPSLQVLPTLVREKIN